MPVTIELEHYCFECNDPLTAEVTGNAVMVKICERCMNLRELNAASEAVKGELPVEDVKVDEPSEVRAELAKVEGPPDPTELLKGLNELRLELDKLKGGE